MESPMEDKYISELSPSILGKSPLNTLYDQLGCSKEVQSDKEEDTYEIPSFQPPKEDTKPSSGYKKAPKKAEKRKATEALPTTEAKIQKTEISIRKLTEHLEKKTCPKTLRYSARANIPADEDFKKDIRTVKEKAEQGFIRALTRFHYRRLEKQKIKLNKDKAKARRLSESGSKCNKSRATPPTAVGRSVKLKKLEELKAKVDQMELELNTDNKDCEKYSHMSVNAKKFTLSMSNLTGTHQFKNQESFLEEVKMDLAEIKITKPKQNLSRNERKALNELKQFKEINLKKADKGNTTVVMNTIHKIQEGQTQINDQNNYRPLDNPMVKETHSKVSRLITNLHHGNHIDNMTEKWLSQTPNPPRIPEFYTLTKIHKPTMTGRPIISGCDGPTERISSFVDTLLQPISKSQESYLKDTTDFINFLEKTSVNKETFLVSMDVTSLYTNIPQEEGIETVCEAYDTFHNNSPPIPTYYLREMLSLILKENSFHFNGKNYLQIHGTAMGTKMAVAFANIFMAKIETQILSNTVKKPTVWKRYIDDVFSLWDASKTKIERFIDQANSHHPTIKFTAEISNTKTTFLDTVIYKGERFREQSILDIKTHFKPTETFQYTHYTSCHPPSVKKGFIKGEALRLLRTNSSETTFEENILNFRARLVARGYPRNLIDKNLSEINFTERKSALKQNKKDTKEILPFVTQYEPAVPNIKQILMKKWHIIEEQPLLKQIFKDPPIISFKKRKSLKDMLVRAKI
ncbi:hypothetical protein ACROYT_G018001 [Oculina patagonica]